MMWWYFLDTDASCFFCHLTPKLCILNNPLPSLSRCIFSSLVFCFLSFCNSWSRYDEKIFVGKWNKDIVNFYLSSRYISESISIIKYGYYPISIILSILYQGENTLLINNDNIVHITVHLKIDLDFLYEIIW